MESKTFKNLYDFFSYIEFCPLCRSRTIETSTFPLSASQGPDLNGRELIFYDFSTPWDKYTINLLDNSIGGGYRKSSYEENCKIVIGRQCTKYHFFYNGTATLSKRKSIIENIFLDKYHFIRIHGTTHFTVNGSLEKSFTSIRITTEDFKTREIILPFIDFNLSSKKKIDAKLRNVQLLG